MEQDHVQQEIEQLVSTNDVVLFMKGRRKMPQCGFSALVVTILDQLLDDYVTVNVLESQDVREGIKKYSSWPTLPQLFIKGQFVGGCDIVNAMHQNGELAQLLEKRVGGVGGSEPQHASP